MSALQGSDKLASTVASTSSTATATPRRRALISIINNGEAYVWSADDVAFLRRNHGIVGLLTGSLPLIPQQNAFLGVPLQLFAEEVVYLLRQGAAIVVDDAAAHAGAAHLDDATRRAWHTERQGRFDADKREVAAAAEENKRKWMAKIAANPKAEARRKAREQQRREQDNDEEGTSLFGLDTVQHDDAQLSTANTNTFRVDDKSQKSSRPTGSAEDVPDIAHSVLIPAASTSLPWHNVRIGENAYDTLSAARSAGLWVYPSTPQQRAHCAAFEALRAKGHYLGKGLRFGGDFVVYPGDPLRYHSHFTATVQTTPSTPVSAQELVAAGRLGTAVKKAHLLCAVDNHEDSQSDLTSKIHRRDYDDGKIASWGSVDFYSLTWAGFGT